MSLKSLNLEIRELDARLDARQRRLGELRAGAVTRLRAVPPLWWLGGGLAAGFLMGRRGGAASLRRVRTGLRLVSLLPLGLGMGVGEL
ncbi:hypothetical protein [Parahaliea mediterranea]|uniref:DUF3618 domain-containing protein n=1 Tax=Parahaliea mediterranea TaxID=651086 RepID=A0A939DE31_9GAMM|nr:hypothetical protein [Parahaliea mediterranea]MBN7796538.1 hypothetical protein [Parahaliea mediterranea]